MDIKNQQSTTNQDQQLTSEINLNDANSNNVSGDTTGNPKRTNDSVIYENMIFPS